MTQQLIKMQQFQNTFNSGYKWFLFISPDLRDDILSKTKCNWPDFLFLGNVKETINYKTSDLIDGANDDSVSVDNYYILHT